MATIIARVNAAINFVTDLVGYTIRINYFLGEALFTLLSWAFGHVTTGTRTLLALIKMAVFDLGQFVEDLGGYVAALVAVAEGLVNLSCQLVATLFFAFLSALASFVSVVIGVGTSVYVTISSILDAIKQLTQVGAKSLVLVLHTIPLGLANGAKQACRALVAGWLATKEVAISVVYNITDGVCLQYRNARSLFRGLPGEAYLGVFLLITLLMVVHYTIRAIYLNRALLLHRSYHVTMKVLSTLRNGVNASLSLSWLQALPDRIGGTSSGSPGGEEEIDSSPSSSFESTPPYNLRQRKPGQRSSRVSRIDSIKRQLQAEKESRLCVICSDRRRSVVVLPCRHFSFCGPCINQSVRYYDHCPVCRTTIEEVVPVYQ
ncbi:E3 ubiquitin-protein ligase RNF26-like [Varroa jacobsoni]|uniref:RING-type domain-containing protein n=1 Tax=Varroa destructor TaxID=109461 RepID=A0A7M7JEP4_VARDE|nr:E3 ubiquitin-protein ligase RNF26-like [Varroa destructor]XP_022649034.1 E3 ubiquitin-protein ligase RNF26-like [Varroa destructor]XP_022649035.1 E3 ubiquitin-protein ligase RNF26-like [Varroa destructor]XP_022698534.1 E3 ubiquitin-protein ligase RNF26-like [Varroa jacobsoni]XP_022698535.1 E3 ubiquitin-protein ligase RNF26-like [Varroa jacobsoni]